jgi:hypothetical protein
MPVVNRDLIEYLETAGRAGRLMELSLALLTHLGIGDARSRIVLFSSDQEAARGWRCILPPHRAGNGSRQTRCPAL